MVLVAARTPHPIYPSAYTTSLTSSVLNYRHENGRRYHAYRDGSYLMPNDETEADRLDILHEMVLTMMDMKLFLAPIESPQRVIDLGTGTGIWAIDFGMSSVIPDQITALT
ncbi:hypothetical protein VTN77DRAFT_1395 [Rasamsonia byssochlamydoides]|uniref:uncharacterized protein n=1 Tax=Rasamsonia byssochlamydoides TaxID=89139 RepID=UPI003743A548